MTGTCEISVEIVDPYAPDRPGLAWVDAAPDTFRGMAGWVVRQCVQGVPSIGGFVTINISNAINYLHLPTATLEYGHWRAFVPTHSDPNSVSRANRVFIHCSMERNIFYCSSTSRDRKC